MLVMSLLVVVMMIVNLAVVTMLMAAITMIYRDPASSSVGHHAHRHI